MQDFLIAPENTPFAVSIVIMVMIAALEAIGLFLGGSLSDVLDQLFGGHDGSFDADLDGEPTTLSAVLSWLRVGQVPFLVLLMVFLTAFGAIGYAVQGFAANLAGSMLPARLAAIPAVLGALPVMHWTAGAIAALLPSEETSAVSSKSFVGLTAIITLGTARRGSPAQARLKDQHGQNHYVMVEPEDAGHELVQGATVRLVRQDGAHFAAAAIDTHSPQED